MCRRLSVVLDRPLTTVFNLSPWNSTLRNSPTNLDYLNSGGLFLRTAHPLILIAVLISRFTNSMRLVALMELINAMIIRICALCATLVFSSPRRTNALFRPSPLFFARWSARTGFRSFILREPATPALQPPRLPCPLGPPGFSFLQMNALVYALSWRTSPMERDFRKNEEMCLGVTVC